MQLLYAPTSPFVRKVVVLAAETGLAGDIERIDANPWDPDGGVPQTNPLGKVPALILKDGRVLPDSKLICEYLDSLHGGRRMIPEDPQQRFETLRLAALAEGVLEAGLAAVIEQQGLDGVRIPTLAAVIEQLRRPEEFVWSGWVERQNGKISGALDQLEGEAQAGSFAGEVDIAQITLGCAFGYLDFRLADLKWRDGRPGLASWYESFARRPSMLVSAPPA